MPSRRTKPVSMPGGGTWAGWAALTPAQPVNAAPPSATLVASIVRLLILIARGFCIRTPGSLSRRQRIVFRHLAVPLGLGLLRPLGPLAQRVRAVRTKVSI